MCEFTGTLIAFLDHELPAEEAVQVELHLETCSECRGRLGVYSKIGRDIEAYCDDAIASGAHRGMRRWIPAASAAGAIAAVVALFLLWPRMRAEAPAVHAPIQTMAEAPVLAVKTFPEAGPAEPVQKSRRTQTASRGKGVVESPDPGVAPQRTQVGYAPPNEPTIQIAIPAEEMFPPGAVPAGMNFVADLTIAADGTAEAVRLRPRLAEIERRTTEP